MRSKQTNQVYIVCQRPTVNPDSHRYAHTNVYIVYQDTLFDGLSISPRQSSREMKKHEGVFTLNKVSYFPRVLHFEAIE